MAENEILLAYIQSLDGRLHTVSDDMRILSGDVRQVHDRLGSMSLNGDVPALKRLANAAPGLIRLSEKADTIILMAIQTEERATFRHRFAEKLRLKSVRWFMSVALVALLSGFGYVVATKLGDVVAPHQAQTQTIVVPQISSPSSPSRQPSTTAPHGGSGSGSSTTTAPQPQPQPQPSQPQQQAPQPTSAPRPTQRPTPQPTQTPIACLPAPIGCL